MNLFRLLLTLVVAAWAVAEIFPLEDTPFADYALGEVSATVGEDGSVVATQEENRTAFQALLDRAQQLVEQHQGEGRNPYPTQYIALRRLAQEESIDLARYFDLNLRDVPNLEERNEILLRELLKRSKGEMRLGLDLNGGVSVTFAVPENELPDNPLARAEMMTSVQEVIRQRVDAYGVAEPIVRVKGGNLVEVQLPGVDTKDNPDLADSIGKPAKLEFSTVHPTLDPRTSPTAPLGYRVMTETIENRETGENIEVPLYVKRIPDLTGDAVNEAGVSITPSGGYEVLIEFNAEGATRFAELTGRIAAGNTPTQVGRLAIILDGELMSAPTVRERIAGGNAVITGRFSQREAIELATALNNPLSQTLSITEMYEVSPTLAKGAQQASVQAGLWGAILVIAFMIAYYRLAGGVATATVLLNILIVVGVMNSFNATISLPGVAALVLTVGMAVDANILIFERLREELLAGKSIRAATTAGFEKAFSTIVDANVTTLITAFILLWLGTGPIQGFGLTLAVGIISTVFTTLITSRLLMEWVVDGKLLGMGAFRFQLFKTGETPFLDYARPAFFTSWAIVALGLLAFVFHFDEAFGIDFRGGEEMALVFSERVTPLEVEEVAERYNLGEASAFYQTPLGAAQELLVVQTEAGQAEPLLTALQTAFPGRGLESQGITVIGAAVGGSVTQSAILAVTLSMLAIVLYIAIRFEFGFGLGAFVATIHDIFMTVGLYIILSEFFGIGAGQFSAPMIAAILMVVGYSINDTIVVFDRIREELQLNPTLELRRVVHLSINRTLNRTVLTSVTTMFSALVLFLFGAGVIQDFALVFLLGVLTGTFSSVFIASPVFYWYHKGDRRHVEKHEILPSYDWTSDTAPGRRVTT